MEPPLGLLGATLPNAPGNPGVMMFPGTAPGLAAVVGGRWVNGRNLAEAEVEVSAVAPSGGVATPPPALSSTPDASEPTAADQAEQNRAGSSEPPAEPDPRTEPKRVPTIKIPADAATLKSQNGASPPVRAPQ